MRQIGAKLAHLLLGLDDQPGDLRALVYRRRFFASAALGRALSFGGGSGSGVRGCGASFARMPRSARMRGDSGKRSRLIVSLSSSI